MPFLSDFKVGLQVETEVREKGSDSDSLRFVSGRHIPDAGLIQTEVDEQRHDERDDRTDYETDDDGCDEDEDKEYADDYGEEVDDYETTLPVLPQRLKLPLELELLILDYHKDPWDDLWLVQRLVCTTWRDHVEARARNKWIHRAYLQGAVRT